MADNTTLEGTLTSSGDVIRTEEKGAVKVPVTLIDVSGVGTEALIGDAGVFMPVEGAAAHDAASAGNPILLGAEFDDTATDSVDEGDVGTLRIAANRRLYVGIRDDAGNERGLNVDASGQIGVTVAGDALTALQLIDNIVHVDDAAFTLGTSSGVMMMGFAGTQSVDANDAAALACETDGALHIHDGGNTITVDGTVTANLSATDNAVLDQIEVNTSYGDNTGGGTEAGSLRVTIANDSTGVLTVDNGGTFAVQVDAALPAGTNAIGKLAANSGVDIGDVDVLSVVPGTGATNLGKAEDAIHTTGDVGVMSLSVRTNTATARSGTDGDYQPLITDTNGRLHCKLPNNEPINVAQMNSVNVTMGNGVSGTGVQRVTIASDSTGQVAVTGNALTALQLIDDPVFTDDAAFTADTSKVMVAGAVRDDEVGGTAVVGTDGDVAPLRIDLLGNLKTTQIHDATSEIKYAVIDDATSGDNTLVAAAGAGIKIRVLSAFMVAAGSVNARFESGAAGTALTGQMNLTTNSGFVLPFNPGGWFETADNTLLNLELSAAVSVDGCLSYVEV